MNIQDRKTRLTILGCIFAIGLALVIYLNLPTRPKKNDAFEGAARAADDMAAREPKPDPTAPPSPIPTTSSKPAPFGGAH
jgi:hypothetical protein